MAFDFKRSPNHCAEQSVKGNVGEASTYIIMARASDTPAACPAGLNAEYKGRKGDGNSRKQICHKYEQLDPPGAEKHRPENAGNISHYRKNNGKISLAVSALFAKGGNDGRNGI